MSELAQMLVAGLVLAVTALSFWLSIATGERNDLAKENAYLRAKLGLKPDEDIVDGLGLKRPHL